MKRPAYFVLSLALPLTGALLFGQDPKTSATPTPSTPPKNESKVIATGERFVDLFNPFQTDNAALSPDGKYLAYSLREGENLSVVVVEIDKPSAATTKVTVASDKTSTPFLTNTKVKSPAVIRWMRWASATRVVLETNQSFTNHVTGDWTNTTGAIMGFDYDGKNSRVLATPDDVREILPNANFAAKSSFSDLKIRTPDQAPLAPAATSDPDAENASTFDPTNPLGNSDDPAQAIVIPLGLSPRSLQIIDLAPNESDSILIRTAGLQKYDVFKLNVQTAKLSHLSLESINAEDLALPDRQGKARIVVPITSKTAFPHRFALDRHSALSRWTDLDKIAGFKGPGFSLSPDNFLGERAIPLGFDENPDLLYFASNVGRNTYGIYSLDLKTGKRGSLVVENPNFDLIQVATDEYPDPQTLVYDRFSRKLEGIRFESRFRSAVWIRPELASTQKELEAAFKGRSVEIMEWDSAYKRILVLVRGPADAGAFYVFNRETAKLAQFARRAPWLDTNETQPSTDFAFENPKGGGILSGLITLPKAVRMKPVPIVVVCANEPWQRTRSEYNAEVHALADMGLAVVQVNARGTSGFGTQQRQAIQAGYDQAQVEDIGSSLDFLLKQFPFLSPKRIAIVGEDRGAYLALRALQLDPKRYRCAVAINPTVDLASWIADARWGSTSSRPALLKAYFGSAEQLKEASLQNHPEGVTNPICVFSYPGPPEATRSLDYRLARQFASEVKSHDTPMEFYDLDEDYANHLPASRAHLFNKIEDFLNSYLYAYKVDVKEAVPVKE